MLDSLFDVPVAFAFGAGMVAAFNPCGAAMLPAYIGYQLSGEAETSDPMMAVLRGFYLGGIVTAGFVILSLAVGLIVTVGGDAIFTAVPFAGLGVGILITLLGIWMLISKWHMGIWMATRLHPSAERSARGVFLFGIVYGISSLGCAFPVFLAAVGILAGQRLAELDILASLLRFASYGLGMGMVLTGITIGVVFFREAVAQMLRMLFPYVNIAGNLALVVAGMYLIWYWVFGNGSELLTLRLNKLL